MSIIDKESLKNVLLGLLEEDREFRYAVMGLIGFRELLERFTKLEERQQKLEERFAELEERFAKLEERQQRLEERQLRLEEEFKKLEERFARIEERFMELADAVRKLSSTVGSLGRRVGMRFESLLREAYGDLFKRLGIDRYKVEKFTYVDLRGEYLFPGAVVELDIYVHNDETWLIEVKTFVEIDDVLWFYQKAQAVEKILGKKAQRKIILALDADEKAIEQAKKVGIEIIKG